MLLSEKQIPQVVENLENGDESKEALERAVMRPRQVRYQAALRPDIYCSFDSKPLRQFPILSCLPNRSPKNFDPGKTVTKPHQLGLSVSKPGPFHLRVLLEHLRISIAGDPKHLGAEIGFFSILHHRFAVTQPSHARFHVPVLYSIPITEAHVAY